MKKTVLAFYKLLYKNVKKKQQAEMMKHLQKQYMPLVKHIGMVKGLIKTASKHVLITMNF